MASASSSLSVAPLPLHRHSKHVAIYPTELALNAETRMETVEIKSESSTLYMYILLAHILTFVRIPCIQELPSIGVKAMSSREAASQINCT